MPLRNIFLFLFLLSTIPANFNLSFAQDWKEYKAEHFIIYYKQAGIDFVKTVEKSAENDFIEITRNLNFYRFNSWRWEERTKIYIYDNQDEYMASGQWKWSHGMAYPYKKTIYTFPSAAGFFDSTLPHELGHIIFREFIGSKADVPVWFEEGVAMYQEKAKRWGSKQTVKEAIQNGTLIPLPQLNRMRLNNNTDPALVELFYAESANIVYYMIQELGGQRFVHFCQAIKEGKSFQQALEDVYYRFHNLEDLNKSWITYVTK